MINIIIVMPPLPMEFPGNARSKGQGVHAARALAICVNNYENVVNYSRRLDSPRLGPRGLKAWRNERRAHAEGAQEKLRDKL